MNKDRLLALILLIVSAVTFYETAKFPELSNDLQVVDAGFVPKLLALFLTISAGILIYRSYRISTEKIVISLKDSGIIRIGLVLIIMALYGYFLPLIGYELGTVIFLGVLMIIFKLNNCFKIVGISAAAMLAIYYIFIVSLKVPLPLKFL